MQSRILAVNHASRKDEWRQASTKTDSETHEVTIYHYDALGNLLSVDLPDGRLVEYVIDGQNRRIGKKIDGVLTKAWLYQNQLSPIAELDGSGNLTARFIYGSKPNTPDLVIKYSGGLVTTYRVITDHLGSPVMAVNVNNSSDVPFNAEYSTFGERTVSSGAASESWLPFGFAGGLYDADTRLTRFGARDYDAQVGRWVSKDPILFDGGQTNLFVYVGNDPVNYVDPAGTYIQILAGAVLGGVGSGIVYAATASTSLSIGEFAQGFVGALAGGAVAGAGAASGELFFAAAAGAVGSLVDDFVSGRCLSTSGAILGALVNPLGVKLGANAALGSRSTMPLGAGGLLVSKGVRAAAARESEVGGTRGFLGGIGLGVSKSLFQELVAPYAD